MLEHNVACYDMLAARRNFLTRNTVDPTPWADILRYGNCSGYRQMDSEGQVWAGRRRRDCRRDPRDILGAETGASHIEQIKRHA